MCASTYLKHTSDIGYFLYLLRNSYLQWKEWKCNKQTVDQSWQHMYVFIQKRPVQSPQNLLMCYVASCKCEWDMTLWFIARPKTPPWLMRRPRTTACKPCAAATTTFSTTKIARVHLEVHWMQLQLGRVLQNEALWDWENRALRAGEQHSVQYFTLLYIVAKDSDFLLGGHFTWTTRVCCMPERDVLGSTVSLTLSCPSACDVLHRCSGKQPCVRRTLTHTKFSGGGDAFWHMHW